MNINDLCKCVVFRHGTVCTFVDCMGSTFAVGPDGSIYPCYRFVGMPGYAMGNVADCPPSRILQSPLWGSACRSSGSTSTGSVQAVPTSGTAGGAAPITPWPPTTGR